ncbi:unnamed protein product [Phytomonas sp. EM1]|nr:unnamed protein product [Phytomonas sp. EM1]|eukprot:CCW63181.1 unnamed protein product [Phytomonas sp. isolate EM1]
MNQGNQFSEHFLSPVYSPYDGDEDRVNFTLLNDDLDYDSDTSIQTRVMSQPNTQMRISSSRASLHRQNFPSANPEYADYHMQVFPVIYKFSEFILESSESTHHEGVAPLQNIEKIGLYCLKDLINFSPEDLRLRGWNFLSLSEKNTGIAPFSILPDCPNILETRFANTFDISRFMYHISLDLSKRHDSIDPVYLVSKLVKAAVSSEPFNFTHEFTPQYTFDGSLLDPSWESDTNEFSSMEMEKFPSTNDVNEFDFCMVLASTACDKRVPLRCIQLLHQIANKCLLGPQTHILTSWGVQHVAKLLIIQLNEAIQSSEEEKAWILAALSLLWKIVVASSDVDVLLSLLRWNYLNFKKVGAMSLLGIAPLVNSIESHSVGRIRLSLPPSRYRERHVSFAHSLTSIPVGTIKGLCVTGSESDLFCVLFTNSGVYKVSLNPPYIIAQKSSYTTEYLRALFVEGDKVVVWIASGKDLDILDSNSLMPCGKIKAPLSKSSEEFVVYAGNEQFVTPYYYSAGQTRRNVSFMGTEFSGTMNPSSLLLPRTTDSLSVQFFIYATVPADATTTMEVVSAFISDKKWLSVKVALDYQTATMTLTFEHGKDAVAEIEEPICSEWVLWSATLTSLNHIATWAIYRNGVCCDARTQSGPLVRPSDSLFLSILQGRFTGYLACIQVWSREQAIEDMILAGMEGNIANRSQFLLCSFPLDEGIGCYFHSKSSGLVFRSQNCSWLPCPKPLPGKLCTSEKTFWKPYGEYYMTTNEFELVVVEEGYATWINKEGRILEQQATIFSPTDRIFYSPIDGMIYSAAHDNFEVSSIRVAGTPTSRMKELPSMQCCKSHIKSILDRVKEGNKCSVYDIALYLAYVVNINLIILKENHSNFQNLLSFNVITTVSLKTVGRLLTICQEVIDSIAKRDISDFGNLVLCIAGRLLTHQMKLLQCRCPAKVVSEIVSVYHFLQSNTLPNEVLIVEALDVFSDLHRTILAECVSHDYQLKLINESANFRDVGQLLQPNNLLSLVCSVIEKDMKKPFMSFLNRLKEECKAETHCIFSRKPVSFNASEAILTVIFGILSQEVNPQWHLVAVALINTLCKYIIQQFEQYFPSWNDQLLNLDLLKQTFVGVVLFPVAHYLYEMDIDTSFVTDYLRALKDTYDRLQRYALAMHDPSVRAVKITDTYSIVPRAQFSTDFQAKLDLRYAHSLRVEMSTLKSRSEDDSYPSLLVTLINNEYHSISVTLSYDDAREVTFDLGGELNFQATIDENCTNVIITVYADVELNVEMTSWIESICQALILTIIRIPNLTIHKLLHQRNMQIRASSFLRGGLSKGTLKNEDLLHTSDYHALEILEQLARTVEDKVLGSNLVSNWKNMFASKNFPYPNRLENVIMWSCCALTWHSMKNSLENDALVNHMSGILDLLKKKAFLFLEALQQEREEDIVKRARFLLLDVSPRAKAEAHLTELQHTEEPIVGAISNRHSTKASQSVCLAANRGQSGSAFSFGSVDTLQLSNAPTVYFSSTNASGLNRRMTTIRAFNKNLKDDSDMLLNQTIQYLINGAKETTEEIVSVLSTRSRCATLLIDDYKLMEELCRHCVNNDRMLGCLLSSHLHHQNRLIQHLYKGSRDKAGHAEQEIDNHYDKYIYGCGFVQELELHKAFCLFIRTALHNLRKRLISNKEFPLKESLEMCAILCHPWDSVDLSILQPCDIFDFLHRLLSNVFTRCLNNLQIEDKSAAYFESKGIFDLFHRCLITPNSLLHISIEGVHIVDGEVQGLHVEGADIICSARNHWKLSAHANVLHPKSETDWFANYGLPCIVTEFPTVQYFEITLDLCVCTEPKISIGVSFLLLAPTDPSRTDQAIRFSSDGVVTLPNHRALKFSGRWKGEDVIGCGVLAPNNSVFFTRNGEFLGIATECDFVTMIPFVEVHGIGTLIRVLVNFGTDQAFKFNMASLHSSCRHRYLTPNTVCDAILITVHYLITMCFKNFSSNGEVTAPNQDAIGNLLEKSTEFLHKYISEFVELHNSRSLTESAMQKDSAPGGQEFILIMISRLFHCLSLVIECFRFDAVAPKTHSRVLHICAFALTNAHNKWIKVRAAKCLCLVRQVMREDLLAEAADMFGRSAATQEIISQLFELARSKHTNRLEASLSFHKWLNNTTIVRGKGAFFGSTPMPKSGTHIVGFRIRRCHQPDQETGSPLGGCYYVGLCHGQPQISCMNSLINRRDVYVLQDTDDQDQVSHLLLRRQFIPKNTFRRIYGNNELVWVQFNADVGEITFYRENMVLIGLAFANIEKTDDLYPIVFHFNDDASCEILPPPTSVSEPAEHTPERLCRSIAVDTLQQLHLIAPFQAMITKELHRSITRLDRDLEGCLGALAVLGGKRSYQYCLHDTYGLVVLHSVADITRKAAVYLASDQERQLFSVPLQTLKPSFIKIPLYASGSAVSDSCVSLLTNELCHILYEATLVAPLTRQEEEARLRIEEEYAQSIEATTTLDLIGILSSHYFPESGGRPPVADTFVAQSSTSSLITTVQPVVIDRHCSTKCLFTPNPSVGVTTTQGTTTLRGNVIFDRIFNFSVSIAQCPLDSVLYVGMTSSTSTFPQGVEEVANWEDTWALCSCDSEKTNSVNCCVEPGMIFSGGATLFTLGDILIVSVNRHEGTVAFFRLRKGKHRVDFGVLFEGIPKDAIIRPIVVCGPDTIVAFSFMDGVTFPARNTFPVSNFTRSARKIFSQCTVCEALLAAPWYGSEDNITLCEQCFLTWRYPEELFFVEYSSSDASAIPMYLASSFAPANLIKNDYVEFEENCVLSWSSNKSVNIKVDGASCVSIFDEGFAITEPLSIYGTSRVDIQVGFIAGVSGHPFSGLLAFTPLWREDQCTRTTSVLQGDSLLISSSVVPFNSKALFSVRVTEAKPNSPIAFANVFIGISNFSDYSYSMTRADMERLCANSKIWGTWCDCKEKICADGTIFVLLDCTHGTIRISGTLEGLYYNPFIITCTFSSEGDENLHPALFSQDTCQVTSFEGFTSFRDTIEPSLSPIAIGLVPETFTRPNESMFEDSIMLMDTISRTEFFSSTKWEFSEYAVNNNNGILFHIDDTLTFIRQKKNLQVFSQGVLIASLRFSEKQAFRHYCLMLYFSVKGLSATFVPPLYGYTHLGRVVEVCGPEVGIVECVDNLKEQRRFTIRRKDVRFCALSASTYHPDAIRSGMPIAFKTAPMQLPKRGIILSVSVGTISVRESDDERAIISLKMDQCFVLDNEGKEVTRKVLYPLVAPSLTASAVMFEVGKSKYGLRCKGSHNGIMFDCYTNNSIEITGLSVLSQTSGRHRADVYFKKGSHKSYERDAHAWTQSFSGFVEMQAEQQFSLTFSTIYVEAGDTFSFFINTSHNCGVGFYCEDDGCHGEVGSVLDNDDTITVFLGRKSDSSIPFRDISIGSRGFCGGIAYRKTQDSKPPLIEGTKCPTAVYDPSFSSGNNFLKLISRPAKNAVSSSVRFTVEVTSTPVRIKSISVPVILKTSNNESHNLVHYVVSTLYRALPPNAPTDQEILPDEWRWAWNTRVLIDSTSTDVVLEGTDIKLSKGRYLIALVVRSVSEEHASCEEHRRLFLISTTDPTYTRRNVFVSVSGFYGDIVVSEDEPMALGETHTMITGTSLVQSNSASYNGIMFDLRSQKDITLEEVFFMSQTNANYVTVRLFWKEGSMIGAEKSPLQWIEVGVKEMKLADKELFSVGPLFLRMKANQTYAIYVNTSSSCGVRFYNSSDGNMGDIGDEFEDDGILSVFVGCKSESSSPFAEVPLDPRAFRGKIIYRTYMTNPTEVSNQAIFSFARAFVLTRILVALSSYVDLTSTNRNSYMYHKLLSSVMILAALPGNTLNDLNVTDNMLVTALNEYTVDELKKRMLAVPLSGERTPLFNTINNNDLGLLVDSAAPANNSLVSIRDADFRDNCALVYDLGKTQTYLASIKSIIPLAKCWQCSRAYATTEVCSSTETTHSAPPDEESRIIHTIANAIVERHGKDEQKCLALARHLLQNPSANVNEFLHPAKKDSLSNFEFQMTAFSKAPNVVAYEIPIALLVPEEESEICLSFTCPFVYCQALGALVSLNVKSTSHSASFNFITDFPIRRSAHDCDRCYSLQLHFSSANGLNNFLMERSFTYIAASNGCVSECIVPSLPSALFACMGMNGTVNINLTINEDALASVTKPVQVNSDGKSWTWENGTVEAQLSSEEPVFLAGVFNKTLWPENKRHFCSFLVIPEESDKTVFLEVHVMEVLDGLHSSSSANSRMLTRRPFSLVGGEVVTLGFSNDEFFIFDANDAIRCRIELSEQLKPDKPSTLYVGFICVDQERVTAILSADVCHKRSIRLSNFTSVPSCVINDFYIPVWSSFDPSRVKLSKDKSVASCSTEVGGQAVLGSVIPSRGVSVFVIRIDRSDRSVGSPLGSGHFAGVSGLPFAATSPLYSELKAIGNLWVVQDVQDGDSLPHQESIPFIKRNKKTNELYCVGTRLLFVVDQNAGTLSLARDNESPRVVFRNIPHGMSLRPFVRLDHSKSYATLTHFSHRSLCSPPYYPSLEECLLSQPITPTFLRRVPLPIVLKFFPIMRHVINVIPEHRMGALENFWNDASVHSRFEYRMCNAIGTMVEEGAFSREMFCCDLDKVTEFLKRAPMKRVMESLSAIPSYEMAVFPPRNQDSCSEGDSAVYFRLPDNYEIVGAVEGTDMIRVVYIDAVKGPTERTLYLIRLEYHKCSLSLYNEVLPHCSAVQKHMILRPLNNIRACGVIIDGWFNCTLATLHISLEPKQMKRVAAAIVCGMEHWHLHGTVHGHLLPENVLLHIENGIFIRCAIWRAYYLHHTSPYAPPGLQRSGVRDVQGDLWGCAELYRRHLSPYLKDYPMIEKSFELLRKNNLTISDVLDEGKAFKDTPEGSGEGPSFTLRIGARLRGGSGSYNGIMFDVLAKSTKVRVTKLTFFPDTTTTATVTLFARDGTFLGFENDASSWKKILETQMVLSDSVETVLEGFHPITIPALSRAGLFIHTTSGSGVLFYSETEGVTAGMGQVEEESSGIGITVGKKSESNKPFTAIQNQKRLLKGSITYTLITRSNGPRSSLIYACDPNSTIMNQPALRILNPIDVKGRGCGFEIISSSSEKESLVMLDAGKYEWVDTENICPCNCTEADSKVEAPRAYVVQKQLEYYEKSILHAEFMKSPWGSLRQLSFMQLDQNNSEAVQYISSPTILPNAIWISERLKKSCVVSLWFSLKQSNIGVYVCEDRGEPSCLSSFSLSYIIPNTNVWENLSHVFFHIDVELGCVFISDYTRVLKCSSLPSENVAFRIVVRTLDKGTVFEKNTTNLRMFAYVNVPYDENCCRIDSDSAILLLDNMEDTVTTNVGGVSIQCYRSAITNSTKLIFATITGLPCRVHVTELLADSSNGGAACSRITKDISEETSMQLHKRISSPLLIEIDRVGKWCLKRDVILTEQSPSLEIRGNVVTQVLRSQPCKCTVFSPRFGKNEIHHVLLRMVCPPRKPIGISFEHLSASEHEVINLPYSFFNYNTTSNYLLSEMREVFIHLHIDLHRKHIYIASSTGTFKGMSDRYEIYPECCLTFTLDSPGTLVEVVSWNVFNARTELSVTPESLSKIAETLCTRFPSSNLSHTVGTIMKYSSRSNENCLYENNLCVSKQLEVLLIGYARLLLEKTLISQDDARQAAQSQLHFYISCTALRSSQALSGIIDDEIRRGSFNLIAQSCAYLLAPSMLQRPAGVKTSVNVLAFAIRNDIMRKVLETDLGPSLTLLLLRTATIYPRSIRHNALRCVQELVANKEVPLPCHSLLVQHFVPLLKMMCRLCKRGEMASTVVQIGVSLVADIIERYRVIRPSLVPPGLYSNIPFPIVICARALIDAITSRPPRPLPEALMKARRSAHCIHHTIVTKPPNAQGMSPCYCVFSENDRDAESVKTFEVVLKGSRKGAVIIGWDLDYPPENPMRVLQKLPSPELDNAPLPSCGYYIEPFRGDVFVCLGRKREKKPLKVKVKPDDVIVVSCSYSERLIKLCLRRGLQNELTTSFSPTAAECMSLPFVYLQHNLDVVLNLDGLNIDNDSLNVGQIYAELQTNPKALDSVPAQSYEFYVELNMFSQTVLEKEPSSVEAGGEIQTHEVAGYMQLSEFLGVNAFLDRTISIQALEPYRKRLHIFDALTLAFSPLINLRRKSELFDIFRVLKNLCSKRTEEKFQADIMRPFQNRTGRRAHVTIHLMQAKPSIQLGPHPALMRSVFGELYLHLQHTSIDTFYVSPIFTVKLIGFGSTDAGGPYRDVLSQLAAEIMTAHPSNEFQMNPLFTQYGGEGASAVMPNTNMMNSTQTPLMLEFFGKLLASFFITRDLLTVEFPPLFWKLLLNEPVSVHDLKVFSPNIVELLEPANLMDHTEEELEEQFSGVAKAWQLIVDKNPHLLLSKSLPPNTLESARLLSQKILENDINRFAEAMHYIQVGFSKVLPLYTLQAFRWQKVRLLICGTHKLSFEAFKSECDIQLPLKESQMFLSVLEDMSDEDRRLLLRFTTGQSRLPIKSRIKVQLNGSKNALPTSSTCFFLLRLPSYNSEEMMRERLLYAIRQCNTIDADGLPRENIIIDL